MGTDPTGIFPDECLSFLHRGQFSYHVCTTSKAVLVYKAPLFTVSLFENVGGLGHIYTPAIVHVKFEQITPLLLSEQVAWIAVIYCRPTTGIYGTQDYMVVAYWASQVCEVYEV